LQDLGGGPPGAASAGMLARAATASTVGSASPLAAGVISWPAVAWKARTATTPAAVTVMPAAR